MIVGQPSFLLTVAMALAWAVFGLLARWRWPADLRLDRRAGKEDNVPWPELVVLVPARNEATLLPRTLPSLSTQAPGRVLLLDDHSSDGTAEVAAALIGRENVVAVPETPVGWSGKVFALAFGIERALERFPQTEFLLFTDADIEHRSGAVGDLLRVAQTEQRDLVSVMARLRCETVWEKLLVPPFVYFFHLLYPFRAVSDDRSKTAAAAGGVVLIRRVALERAGGLAAIRGELIDDVSLAGAVKRSGGKLWLGLDAGIRSIRPYRFGDLWNMVARNAFVQLRFRWELLFGTVIGMLLFFVAPLALTLWFVARWVGISVSPAPGLKDLATPAILSSVAWLMQALHCRPAYRHHGVSSAFAFALPVAALFYLAMTVHSALRYAFGTTSSWRGRVYRR